ncbi:MAG: 3-phosphoshikimate 1-carboxyvinyltransferase [Chloroflexota bacterium]|nr:3-phosphoshikimate 1-carboxyvinyltransferase [Chloroflexota bacterium]
MADTQQLTIETVERPLSASVVIPGSKSISNRVLLLSALAEGVSTLTNVQVSDDTLVFVRALQSLGFGVEETGDAVCTVTGAGGGAPNASASVWCGSAGTAARFLLASVAAGEGDYHFDSTAQMKRRPMHTLISALRSQGVGITTETGTFPLDMATRGLAGGPAVIDARESSQFTSAFLMAAPLCHTPLELEADVQISRPYIDMTTRLMEQFGVAVERPRHDLFLVGNGHGYRARDIAIEPDASTASYFAAAAAVAGGRVTVEHLPMEGSLQGDTRFLRVLEEMGCRLTQAGSSTTVEGPGPGSLRGVTVDMGDFSDTMMTLACVAPFADSPTTITNIAHVRGKESDRVHSVAAGLEAMGVRVAETESTITVYPAKPHGATIDTFGDHRIAMAFSVMGLVTPGVVIDDYRCVDKTCPEFFELFEDMVAQG